MKLIDAERINLVDVAFKMVNSDYKGALRMLLSEIKNAPAVDERAVFEEHDKRHRMIKSFLERHGETKEEPEEKRLTNAEVFQNDFGIYATEMWCMTEAQFLEWLNGEYGGWKGWEESWNETS